MEIKLLLIFHICSQRSQLFIQLHHLQQWQNMLMNGLLQVVRISLEKQFSYKKCNLKQVLPVPFMALYKQVHSLLLILLLKVCS